MPQLPHNKNRKRISTVYKNKLKRGLILTYTNKIFCGDALKVLKTIPSESIDCVITSPPYWALRDYGMKGQIGLEKNIDEYLEKLLLIFDEVKRVLKQEGTCFAVFGDTYANSSKGGRTSHKSNNAFDNLVKKRITVGFKPKLKVPDKSLCKIPARFAIGMIDRGWILRNEIIWHKTNAMPEGVKDRFTRNFEKVFFFTKNKKYYFKQQFEPLSNPNEMKRRFRNPFDTHSYWNMARKKTKSVSEIKKSQKKILKKGRNKRCVWHIATGQSKVIHCAAFPEKLIETPIKAGCPKGGIVLDPFIGSGTTAVVARKLKRNFIGIELKKEYAVLARKRISETSKEL